jgi:hypothetical protein
MKWIPFFAALLFAMGTMAQPKPKPKPRAAAPAAKPGPAPKVVASIAGLRGGNINTAVARMLIDSSLKITDEAGRAYPLYKFTFIYKRKNTYEDEMSGDKKVAYEWLSTDIRDNKQLDDLWRTTVKGDLKPGEEIYFEGIVADSKKGYMLPAPAIKFVITN